MPGLEVRQIEKQIKTDFTFFLEVLAHSTPTHIILNNAASDTSGVFRCEVSAGPPRFSTASRTTHLQIVGEKCWRYWGVFVKTTLDYSCERLGSIKSYKRMKIC